MITNLFWFLILLLFYIFIGYPAILKFIALFKTKRAWVEENYSTSVSIILSVYNEEKIIRDKIENFLSLDYPQKLLEMVIISDRCTDNTENIINSFSCDRIKLLTQKRRSGKTTSLNFGVSSANGDIILFTDANSMFAKDAVRKLIRHFANPEIGLVSGRSIYLDSKNANEEIGNIYRRYEESIKMNESSLSSLIGADGAIYALRRELYEPLDPKYINDFIHPIQVVLKGYKAINDAAAICTENIDIENGKDELRRQTRIIAQSWLIYLSQIGRLIKEMNWIYAWELTSHKFLRWLTLPIMLLLFIFSIMLFKQGVLFQCVLFLEIIFIFSIILGWKDKIKFLKGPYVFFLIHLAALLGLYNLLSGNLYIIWNPRNN